MSTLRKTIRDGKNKSSPTTEDTKKVAAAEIKLKAEEETDLLPLSHADAPSLEKMSWVLFGAQLLLAPRLAGDAPHDAWVPGRRGHGPSGSAPPGPALPGAMPTGSVPMTPVGQANALNDLEAQLNKPNTGRSATTPRFCMGESAGCNPGS